MNIVRMWVLGVVFFLGACASANGADTSNPDARAATGEMMNAFCGRLESCRVMAPGDVAGCVSTAEDKHPAGEKEACTQAQVDQCTRDLGEMSCADAIAAKLPASCDGC